jgi:protein TonB
VVGRVPDESSGGDGASATQAQGRILQGDAIRRVEPIYPGLAKAARIAGMVPVELIIDENGDVISARALGGHPLLKESAVAAARAWKFKPTTLSGTAVKVIGTVTFTFAR